MARERALVARILRSTGIRNDDGALVWSGAKTLADSTDISFSSTHSPRGTSYYSMGWRRVAACMSDVAAMGAKPLAYFLALGLPERQASAALPEIVRGTQDACRAHGAHYVGGDTKKAKEITLAGFALGVLTGTPLFRSLAMPGDVIAVTGTIGNAFCGRLALSLSGKDKARAKPLIASFLKPRARVKPALAVSSSVQRAACMDVSDGLLFTCSELARLGRVKIELEASAIPISPAARAFAGKKKISFRKLVDSGEDYELVFALSPHDFARLQKAAGLKRIGVVKKGSGLLLDGRKIATSGYDAFRN
ncbi:Thiamine-monophosphate kinase [Candidatus Burarchaeum australiense]|nr:Thiamine-monophosphate kinase [Candidatus Burarchaeum australiense]